MWLSRTHNERRPTRGFTIIEILVVTAIMGLVLGGAIVGFRSIARTELRSSASKLAAAIRYCFDRSVTTDSYFRIVIDLDNNKYWAERSDDRVYLAQGKENSGGDGKAYDREGAERRAAEDEATKAKEAGQKSALAAVLDPAPRLKKPKFQTFKDASLPQIQLRKTRVFDVYTARQREAYTQGKAYLYFFPDGHTERAIIRLNDGDNFYSLVIQPLTGKVQIVPNKVDLPKEFLDADNHEVAR